VNKKGGRMRTIVKKESFLLCAVFCASAFFVLVSSGCVVRTYQTTRDRVDQDINIGNRGYVSGQAPAASVPAERQKTRTVRNIEIELHSPIKFERMSKKGPVQKEKTQDADLWGNRGFITESEIAEKSEPLVSNDKPLNIEKYTVQKNDTLQKISQKFYGTTRKWNKIYEANKNVLRSPNNIYPGQVIKIPLESLKEPKENLK
jgi:nucleoid-associated protein YgaU